MAKTMTKSAARLILGIVIAVLVFALGMTITFVVADKAANGSAAANGKSAYEIAVDNGFTGTEAEWLASLKGETGSNGTNGTDGNDGNSVDIGTKWFTGNGLPASQGDALKDAKDGDFYINLNTNTIYILGDSSWSVLVNVNEQNNVSKWDGKIPGWQAPNLSDEEIVKNRPASYVVTTDAKGNVTAVDLYNAEAFAWFAYRAVIGKTGYEDVTINLHCDIDLDGQMWMPIGIGARSNAPGVVFQGTFDGNGHTISNLDMGKLSEHLKYGVFEDHLDLDEQNKPKTKTGYYVEYANGDVSVNIAVNIDDSKELPLGLFANSFNATFKNITIENVNLDMNTENTNGLDAEHKVFTDSVGALVGFARGDLTLENITVGTKDGNDVIKTDGTAGGVIGRYYGGKGVDTNGVVTGKLEPYGQLVISDCVNYVDVTVLDTQQDDKVGGIVGYPNFFSKMNISNAVNYGDIEGYYAGGVVGYRAGNGIAPGRFYKCENYGNVIGQEAGGIIGRRWAGDFGSNSTFVMSECANHGDVVGKQMPKGNRQHPSSADYKYTKSGNVQVGGFIGYMRVVSSRGFISNCYNYGNITVEEETAKIDINACGIVGCVAITKPLVDGNPNPNPVQGGLSLNGIMNCGNIKVVSNGTKFNVYGCAYVSISNTIADKDSVFALSDFYNNGVIDATTSAEVTTNAKSGNSTNLAA